MMGIVTTKAFSLLAGTGSGHIYTPLGYIIGHVYQSMITLIFLCDYFYYWSGVLLLPGKTLGG